MTCAGPSLSTSAARIFDLALPQMLWSRRSVFLALLAGGPVALAILIRIMAALPIVATLRVNGAPVSTDAVFGMLVWLLYLRFVVPVLGLFYGTSLIADEVEDRTIIHLFTRPVPRGAVLLGKYAAYLVCTLLLVLPSVVIAYFLLAPLGAGIGPSFPALAADLAVLAAGLVAYGAVFAWVGARMSRPLLVGLVFAFGWEPAVLLVPGYLKWLTVAFYLDALVPYAMPQESAVGMLLQAFQQWPRVGTSLIGLALITGGFLWAATRAVTVREYVLEP